MFGRRQACICWRPCSWRSPLCARVPQRLKRTWCEQYFRASGLRDNQTLANFAVVSFDPKTEGR